VKNKRYIFGFIGIMFFLIIMVSIMQYLTLFLTQGEINIFILAVVLIGVAITVL